MKLHIREQQPQPPPHTPHTGKRRRHQGHCSLDARNHYPQIKHHTPPPSGATTTTPEQLGRHPRKGDHRFRFPTNRAKKRRGLVVSKPNSVSSEFPPALDLSIPDKPACLLCTRTTPTTGAAHPTNRSAHRTPTLLWAGHESRGAP